MDYYIKRATLLIYNNLQIIQDNFYGARTPYQAHIQEDTSMLDCYLETDCYEDYCPKCEETENILYYSVEFLESVLEQIYSSKPLDPLLFEDHLGELCCYLKIKLPDGELQIQRKL